MPIKLHGCKLCGTSPPKVERKLNNMFIHHAAIVVAVVFVVANIQSPLSVTEACALTNAFVYRKLN